MIVYTNLLEYCNKFSELISLPLTQIDSSTIDGNIEFVHSQNSCILSSQVSIQTSCIFVPFLCCHLTNNFWNSSSNLINLVKQILFRTWIQCQFQNLWAKNGFKIEIWLNSVLDPGEGLYIVQYIQTPISRKDSLIGYLVKNSFCNILSKTRLITNSTGGKPITHYNENGFRL